MHLNNGRPSDQCAMHSSYTIHERNESKSNQKSDVQEPNNTLIISAIKPVIDRMSLEFESAVRGVGIFSNHHLEFILGKTG